MKKQKIFTFIGASIAIAITLSGMIYQMQSQHSLTRDIASINSISRNTNTIKFQNKNEISRFMDKNNLNQVEFAGTLIIEDIDFFKSNTHIQNYYILSGETKMKINPTNAESLSHLNGKNVSAIGWESQENSKLSLFITEDFEEENEHIVQYARPEQMLVLLVDFNDSINLTPRSDGKEIVRQETLAKYLNEKAFKKYFDDTFRGQANNIVTQVEDWYTFDRNCIDKSYPGVPPYKGPGYIDQNDLIQIVGDRNIDVEKFKNITILVNCNQPEGWGVASSTVINSHRLSTSAVTLVHNTYFYGDEKNIVKNLPSFPNYSFLDVLIHERLHNFGVGHANGLDCGNSTIIFPCTQVTYGNPFDVMGRRRSSFGLNADLLYRNKIRAEEQFLQINQPGIYTIDELESADSKTLIAAYVKSPFVERPIFMLENRKAFGMDKTLIDPESIDIVNGLLLYSSISPAGLVSASYNYEFKLIDPDPKPELPITEGFIDRVRNDAIIPGKPFFDPMTGIRITVLPKAALRSSLRVNALLAQQNNKITFKVEYDDVARMCWKTKMETSIDPHYFSVNGVGVSSKEIARVKPGDKVTINSKTYRTDEEVCPREKIETIITGTQMLYKWLPKKGDGEWGFSKPGPGDNDPESEYISYNLNNINQTVVIFGYFIVPADAIPGFYEYPVTYSNARTGESFKSILKLQVLEETPNIKLKTQTNVFRRR